MENIGNRIYELRKKYQVSQEELAEMLHVSRQSISKWENNSSVPELAKLVQVCEIFNLSLDELVRGKVPEPQIQVHEGEKRVGIKTETVLKFLGSIEAALMPIVGLAWLLESIGQYRITKEYELEWKHIYTAQEYVEEQPFLVLQGILGVLLIILAGYMVWNLCKRVDFRWICAGGSGLILGGSRFILMMAIVRRGATDSGKNVLQRLANRFIDDPYRTKIFIFGGSVFVVLGILVLRWYGRWNQQRAR
ncbi:helix-turn-helix transcriptional regulator [Roseburia hominis]